MLKDYFNTLLKQLPLQLLRISFLVRLLGLKVLFQSMNQLIFQLQSRVKILKYNNLENKNKKKDGKKWMLIEVPLETSAFGEYCFVMRQSRLVGTSMVANADYTFYIYNEIT
jgi:hypothetical protein